VIFDQWGQRQQSERRQVNPPIQVESATWTAAGELDYWVREKAEWWGRVRGRTAITSGSEPPISVQRTRAGEQSAYRTRKVNSTFGATNFPVTVPTSPLVFLGPADDGPGHAIRQSEVDEPDNALSIDQAVVQIVGGLERPDGCESAPVSADYAALRRPMITLRDRLGHSPRLCHQVHGDALAGVTLHVHRSGICPAANAVAIALARSGDGSPPCA
jgi:hypothetical protein